MTGLRMTGPTWIQRGDAALARLEGLIVTVLLLAMIAVAAGQALWFNLAERGIGWAARILEASGWADPFLQKGTLWLAFLGASLATHDDKHFAIDLLIRIVPRNLANVLVRTGALGAGLVALVLAVVFFHASLASDATVPFEYERLTFEGRQHVCDTAAAAEPARPQLFCAARAALAATGVRVSTAAGASQLVVPLMLVVIGLRLLARAAGCIAPSRGPSKPPEDAAGQAASSRAPGSEAAS